jgi:hypothetical protein
LGKDGRGAEGLDSGALPADGGFFLDLQDQRGDQLLPLLRRQVLAARLSPEALHVSGSDRVEAAVTIDQLLRFGDKRLRQYLGRLLWCATAITSTPPWISR